MLTRRATLATAGVIASLLGGCQQAAIPGHSIAPGGTEVTPGGSGVGATPAGTSSGSGVEVTSYGGFTYLISVDAAASKSTEVTLKGLGDKAVPAPVGKVFVTLSVRITNTSDRHGTGRDEPLDQVVYQQLSGGLILGALVLAVPSADATAFGLSVDGTCSAQTAKWFIVDPKLTSACPLGTGLLDVDPNPSPDSCCVNDLLIPAGGTEIVKLATMDAVPEASSPLRDVQLWFSYATCPMCAPGFKAGAPLSIPVPAG